MSNAPPLKDLARARMSPSRADEVDALTFGIEFEFALAARLTPTSPDPNPTDAATIDINTSGDPHYTYDAWIRVQKHIANSLIRYGIPAFSSIESFRLLTPETRVLTPATAFTVNEDASIKAPDE